MANETRGFVPIQLDRTRTLHYDFNSFCEMEIAFGKFYHGETKHGSAVQLIPIYEILDKFSSKTATVNDLKLMLWGGLIHEDPELTVADMPRILRGIDFGEIYEQITRAVQSSVPESGGGNSSDPPELTEAELNIGGTSSE